MIKRLIKIYSNEFWEEQDRAFCYKPDPKYTKLVGVISSLDTAVSLSLKNGTSSKINHFVSFRENEMNDIPPNNRIITLNEPLDGCTITGVITNTKTVHSPSGDRVINLYLMVEEREQ